MKLPPDRKFSDRLTGACAVGDLTYVRVGSQWAYIGILLDLGAGEIIGHSAEAHKTAEPVQDAFTSAKGNLFEIQPFRSDRCSGFDNILIDEFLESFDIRRSLSMKGCPYDNAVAESTFRRIKAEFVAGRRFESIEPLELERTDYVHWFNRIRLHHTPGYRTPVEFRKAGALSFLPDERLTTHFYDFQGLPFSYSLATVSVSKKQSFIAGIAESLWNELIHVQLDRLVMDEKCNFIISVELVVPQKVTGMANHSKKPVCWNRRRRYD